MAEKRLERINEHGEARGRVIPADGIWRLAGALVLVLMAACSAAPTVTVTGARKVLASSRLAGQPPCPDPVAVVTAFYAANDAGNYEASRALLAPGATLATWGEGVNGRHWQERHRTGWEQIQPVLDTRGLRRDSGVPGQPIFYEADVKVRGEQVDLMLRPDRVGMNGRVHDPYAVTALVSGCQIKSLTVVERFTAP